jgi:hypothetical protein
MPGSAAGSPVPTGREHANLTGDHVRVNQEGAPETLPDRDHSAQRPSLPAKPRDALACPLICQIPAVRALWPNPEPFPSGCIGDLQGTPNTGHCAPLRSTCVSRVWRSAPLPKDGCVTPPWRQAAGNAPMSIDSQRGRDVV